MHSVPMVGPVVYRHIDRPQHLGPLACPHCQTEQVAFHSFRHRVVEHPDVEQPTYLVLKVAKYAGRNDTCTCKYFTPAVAEAAPYAHTSRRLHHVSSQLGAGSLPCVTWKDRCAACCTREPANRVSCAGTRLAWTGTSRTRHSFPSPPSCASTRSTITSPGSDSRCSVAWIPWPISPSVFPSSERMPPRSRMPCSRCGPSAPLPRSLCPTCGPPLLPPSAASGPRHGANSAHFHVMQWVTRVLARLLKEYSATVSAEHRKALHRLRFHLLASPERQARLSERQQTALTGAWELLHGSVVQEAIELRNQLRTVLTTSTDGWEARRQFDRLRQTWPERFRPWTFRLGEPLPTASTAQPATGLRAFLEEIMAFFVRHFAQMITYLDHPGVPRTSNHAERANRRSRQIARSRYGWGTPQGQRAMLVALQGFDSS